MQYYVRLIRAVCHDGKKIEGFTDWYPEEEWLELAKAIHQKYRLDDSENFLKFHRRFGLTREQKYVPVEVTINAKYTTISKPTEGGRRTQ